MTPATFDLQIDMYYMPLVLYLDPKLCPVYPGTMQQYVLMAVCREVGETAVFI